MKRRPVPRGPLLPPGVIADPHAVAAQPHRRHACCSPSITSRRNRRQAACRSTRSVSARILSYRWPGNIRELSNACERAAIFGTGDPVTIDQPPLSTLEPAAPHETGVLRLFDPRGAAIARLQGAVRKGVHRERAAADGLELRRCGEAARHPAHLPPPEDRRPWVFAVPGESSKKTDDSGGKSA